MDFLFLENVYPLNLFKELKEPQKYLESMPYNLNM